MNVKPKSKWHIYRDVILSLVEMAKSENTRLIFVNDQIVETTDADYARKEMALLLSYLKEEDRAVENNIDFGEDISEWFLWIQVNIEKGVDLYEKPY